MDNLILVGAINIMALLVTCVIGAVSGFLAGKIIKGGNRGLVANICVGVVGALLFGYLFGQLHLVDLPYVNEIAAGTIGAAILLVVLGLFNRVTESAVG